MAHQQFPARLRWSGSEVPREHAIQPRLAGSRVRGIDFGHHLGVVRGGRAFGQFRVDAEAWRGQFGANCRGGVARTLHRAHP